MFQKKTLRRMYPKQRELAKNVNRLELEIKRLKKQVIEMGSLEHDSRALANMNKAKAVNEVTPTKDPNEIDWKKESALAKVTSQGGTR